MYHLQELRIGFRQVNTRDNSRGVCSISHGGGESRKSKLTKKERKRKNEVTLLGHAVPVGTPRTPLIDPPPPLIRACGSYNDREGLEAVLISTNGGEQGGGGRPPKPPLWTRTCIGNNSSHLFFWKPRSRNICNVYMAKYIKSQLKAIHF